MIRVPLDKAHEQRTLRPLYGWTQATPKHVFLDPEWDRSVDIFPGMVAMKTEGDNVAPINEVGDPIGFFGMYVAPQYGIDELINQGVNAPAVWVLGPDAEFEVLDPAFDTEAEWVEPGDGTTVLLYGATSGPNRGKLTPDGAEGARPVARLIRVSGPGKIVIGGLAVGDA